MRRKRALANTPLDLHVGFFFASTTLERHVSDSFHAPSSASAGLNAVGGTREIDGAAGPHATTERWAWGMQGIGAIGEKGGEGNCGGEIDEMMREGEDVVRVQLFAQVRVVDRGWGQEIYKSVGEENGGQWRAVIVEERKTTGF